MRAVKMVMAVFVLLVSVTVSARALELGTSSAAIAKNFAGMTFWTSSYKVLSAAQAATLIAKAPADEYWKEHVFSFDPDKEGMVGLTMSLVYDKEYRYSERSGSVETWVRFIYTQVRVPWQAVAAHYRHEGYDAWSPSDLAKPGHPQIVIKRRVRGASSFNKFVR